MTQYDEIMQLLNDGSGDGASPSLFDPFAAVREILPIILIWSFVIASIFILLWVISTISRVRAERAMVHMQKDMKAVRELLEQNLATGSAQSSTLVPPSTEVKISKGQ